MPSSFAVKDCLIFEDRHYVLTKCWMQMLKKILLTLTDSNTHKTISCISGTISSKNSLLSPYSHLYYTPHCITVGNNRLKAVMVINQFQLYGMGTRWYYIISTLHAILPQDKPTTNSTQHRPPSEANSCSVSQEIPKVLHSPHVHHHMHNPITGPYPEPD